VRTFDASGRAEQAQPARWPTEIVAPFPAELEAVLRECFALAPEARPFPGVLGARLAAWAELDAERDRLLPPAAISYLDLPATRLVGREDELAEITKAAWAVCRSGNAGPRLGLVGPAGSGKHRLATEARVAWERASLLVVRLRFDQIAAGAVVQELAARVRRVRPGAELATEAIAALDAGAAEAVARALAPTWESASALILERLDAASDVTRAFVAALLARFAGVALVTAETADALLGLGARVRRLEALAAAPAAALSRAVLGGPLAAGAAELMSAAPRLPGTLIDWLGEEVAAGRLRRGYDGTWEVGSEFEVSSFALEDSGGRPSAPCADRAASGSEVTQETLNPPPGGPPFHLPPRAQGDPEQNTQPKTPNPQLETRSSLSPDELLTRGHIGSCRLLSFIGQGGMGMVFRGEQGGETVAVKVARLANPAAALRFRDEMRTLAALAHPNIVTMRDVVHDPELDLVGIVMEYLPTSLADLLRSGAPMPVPAGRAALAFLHRLLRGLGYLESAGVLHLDLKPENILVEVRDEAPQPGSPSPAGGGVERRVALAALHGERIKVLIPKIADFGLARRRQQGDAHALGGTRLWAAPELLARLVPQLGARYPELAAALPSPQTDLYAFALVAFRMLAGRLPFAPADLGARFHWVPDLEVAIGVPRELQPALFRCLNREPDERPRSALELLGAWDEALEDAGTDWPALVQTHLVAPALTLAARRCAESVVRWLGKQRAAAWGGEAPRMLVRGPRQSGRSRLLRTIGDLVAIELGVAVVREVPTPPHQAPSPLLPPLAGEGPEWGAEGGRDTLLLLDDVAGEQDPRSRVIESWPGPVVAAADVSTELSGRWRTVRLPPFAEDDARELLLTAFATVVDVEVAAERLAAAAAGRVGRAVRLLRSMVATGVAERTETLAWYLDWERVDEAARGDPEEMAVCATRLSALAPGERLMLASLALAGGPVDERALAAAIGGELGTGADAAVEALVDRSEADGSIALHDAFVGASLRACPPLGVDPLAVAGLVAARDPLSAFRLLADDGADAGRRRAGELGVALLADTWERELAADHTLEVAGRMERQGLWPGAVARFMGHHARAWTYFEGRDLVVPELAESLAILDAESRTAGDATLQARAVLLRTVCLPRSQEVDEIALDAAVAVLVASGSESLRFEAELGRGLAFVGRAATYMAAGRRFLRALETFAVEDLPPRLLAIALGYLWVFTSTQDELALIRPFARRVGVALVGRFPRVRDSLDLIEGEIKAADSNYGDAYHCFTALTERIRRKKATITWNLSRSNARTYAVLMGDLPTARRHATALVRVLAPNHPQASGRLGVLAEIARLEGRYSEALENVRRAEAGAAASNREFFSVVEQAVLCDIGRFDVEALEGCAHTTRQPETRCLAWFTTARCLLRLGRHEDARRAAAAALAVPLCTTSDLRYNALTVAARIALTASAQDSEVAERTVAQAWLDELPGAVGRWFSVRRVLLARLQADPHRAETLLQEGLSFALEHGMLPFALEAAGGLAELTGLREHVQRCHRLAEAIATDLSTADRQTFLESWRTICP
ncbi:MAG: protein kinase, partial [Candidatus Schekmanbacteria bacterium]|nr:protein kinase [Candidatus Schekmanbacteria bacterium]